MKVLVTGATGFLGKVVCQKLIDQGHEVVGMGRNPKKGQELTEMGAFFLKGDLANRDDVKQATSGVEAIIHSGALSSPWGQYEDFYNTNVLGTRYLIEAGRQQSIKRFVHISSTSVYFDFTNKQNIKEDDPIAIDPPSMYTQTKILAEKEIQSAFKEDGFPGIIIRPRGLFGPEDTAIIPRLIRAYDEGKLPIIGNGENIIDMTYVDNVADAAILAISTPESNCGEIFNITNGEPVHLWSFIEKVLGELDRPFKRKKVPYPLVYGIAHLSEIIYRNFLKGKEPTLTRYSVGLLAKTQTLNIDKAKNQLGYNPGVNMQEGLKRTVNWWQATH